MKTYQIKTYNIDWSFKDTINPNDVLNEISFSSNINWWVGQLTIRTTYKITNSDYIWWEYVKVRLYDENHKDWLQIYFGYISQIIRTVESSREYTSFVCLWVSSLLNNILFTNWEYTETPSEMISDVLNLFQTEYDCIIPWNIESSDSTAQNYNREFANCFDVIKAVCEWTWFKFFVDWEWKLNYFNEWTSHFLHLHYDIEQMTITDTLEDVVNEYLLARKWWTIATYSDEASQENYWKKELFESNSELNSANTQDQYWNQYIAENKNPKETMQITVNTKYPFEDIKPWDRITVLNAWIEIVDKVVNKISYKPDKCVLTIDKTDTLWSVIS